MLKLLLEKDPATRFQNAVCDSQIEYKNYIGGRKSKPIGNASTLVSTSNTTIDSPKVDSISVNKDNTKPEKSMLATLVDTSPSNPTTSITSTIYYPPHYDRLRLSPLFDCLFDSQAVFHPLDSEIISKKYITENEVDWSTAIDLTAPNALYTECKESTTSYYNTTLTNEQKSRVNFLKKMHLYTAQRVPRLSELCLRAVASACVVVTEAAALAGGLRADVPWMKVSEIFILKKVSYIHKKIAFYF